MMLDANHYSFLYACTVRNHYSVFSIYQTAAAQAREWVSRDVVNYCVLDLLVVRWS